MKGLPFKLAGIISLILLAESAWSDVSIPGAAQPEVVGKALYNQQPSPTPQVLPPVLTQKQPPSLLTKEAQKIKFQLNGIILEGNHIYSDSQLRPLFENDLHKVITIAELFNIVQSITNFYRNNGYILSRAILPPQHVKNGIVRIKIIEGYIGNVTVVGTPRGAKCAVQRYGYKIKERRPLELSRTERYLLLANEIPGTQVRAVLTPSKTEIGAADLALFTINDPITSYFSYDNYGSRYIGPQQITGNMTFNSFITSGDSTSVTITKTPKGGELNYTDVNYNMLADDNGTRWLIGGTRVHTHPLFVLRPLQIDGLNNNYYTTLYFPLIRTRSDTLTARISFNYLDSQVTTLDQPLYTDHVRSLDLGATYNFADSWGGANLVSGDFRQGLPTLGYSSDTNPATATTSRPGGRGDYTKISTQLSRLQPLWGPISLWMVVQGQWAFNPLLASEQFTFGGSQIGRGYDVAEIIGDKGAAGSAELRYDLSVNRLLIQTLQFYAYYDIGAQWNYKFIGGVPKKVSGTITGVGMRFLASKYISGNVMWTQELTKQVAAEEFIGRGRRPRVFFSIVATFN